MFAQRLEDRSFKRDTIIEALRVDKTELSRMLRVSRGIPHELIYKIGPAATVGRRRWGDLVDAISSIDWGREGGSIMEAADRPDITSDDRFAVVLAVALERVQPTAPAGSTPQSTPGRQQGRGPELTTVDQAEPATHAISTARQRQARGRKWSDSRGAVAHPRAGQRQNHSWAWRNSDRLQSGGVFHPGNSGIHSFNPDR